MAKYEAIAPLLRQFELNADGLAVRLATPVRNLLAVLFMSSLTACSLATINNATIVERSESRVKVLVVTDTPLKGLDGSWCIDHVYLAYRVDPSVVTRNLNTNAEEWQFPFSATERNYVSCPTGTAGHCSEWSIKIAAETSIDNISYKYQLANKSAIQLQLGGGSMVGCVQRSNVYKLNYIQ